MRSYRRAHDALELFGMVEDDPAMLAELEARPRRWRTNWSVASSSWR